MVSTQIPEELRLKLHMAVAGSDGARGVRRVIHDTADDELKELTTILENDIRTTARMLENLGLPEAEEPSVWVVALGTIKDELTRRQRPKYQPSANSPIARLKSMDLVQVAEHFTKLTPAGDKHRGLCPIHEEKSPSFFINPTRQKWNCYGCGRWGDVVDLLELLAEQGKHL